MDTLSFEQQPLRALLLDLPPKIKVEVPRVLHFPQLSRSLLTPPPMEQNDALRQEGTDGPSWHLKMVDAPRTWERQKGLNVVVHTVGMKICCNTSNAI